MSSTCISSLPEDHNNYPIHYNHGNSSRCSLFSQYNQLFLSNPSTLFTMWFLCLVFLCCGLKSSFSSSLNDCLLNEKWLPGTIQMKNRRFNEIYRPNDPNMTSLAYFLSLETPYVSIYRTEINQNYDSCHYVNNVFWFADNMSFNEAYKSSCLSFPFDWKTLLVYFNEEITLGVLTECSGKQKIRHVLYHLTKKDTKLPSKEKVQDLVMRFEGKTINLNDTLENFRTFMNIGDQPPECSCDNSLEPTHNTRRLGYSYLVLGAILIGLAINICYAYWK